MLDRLAQSRDVVAIDFPGFGESPDLPAGFPDEVDAYVRTIHAFCVALDLGTPHVAGNSMGGLVGLRLGQIGAVRSVTALSPAGIWTPRERAWALSVMATMHRAALRTPPTVVRRLARTPSGRRVITGMVYHRPERRSPEAVVAEAAAMRGAAAFDRVFALGKHGMVFEGDVPEDGSC